jgi:hypothetical protein
MRIDRIVQFVRLVSVQLEEPGLGG